MVEDLEISLRIQSENYIIENVVDANVYTSGVKTLNAFINQRIRWFCGFLIQMKKYKRLFSKKYGNLGVFVLPLSVFYVFLTVFVFIYTLIFLIYNTVKWIWQVHLVGISFKNIFDIGTDPFFMTVSNTTVLPFILFLVVLFFMYYIKKKSDEKQGVFLPFILFNLSYWLLGPFCWVISIYFYITKRKVKWGPNYFKTR
jgi:cellulose synthase/poly-beta-1,6-N-acetylglucosamine synthase-like glycosyltransferase